jgi:hypothetical protein
MCVEKLNTLFFFKVSSVPGRKSSNKSVSSKFLVEISET